MNIGIDLDDTMTNNRELQLAYGQRFDHDKLKENNLVNPNGKLLEDIFNWSTETAMRMWKEEGLYEAFKTCAPRPFAKEVINDLWLDGNKIFIITARDNIWFDNAFEDSKNWLELNEIKYDKVIAEAEDKVKVCKELGVDIFIDDSPMNCLEVANTGIKTFIYDNTYNQDFRDVRIKHIYTWIQFRNEVRKYIKSQR